jgi:hypothetical protein
MRPLKRALFTSFGWNPNHDVLPPSWRLNGGWKPALHGKLGHYPTPDFLPAGKGEPIVQNFSYRQENGAEFS